MVFATSLEHSIAASVAIEMSREAWLATRSGDSGAGSVGSRRRQHGQVASALAALPVQLPELQRGYLRRVAAIEEAKRALLAKAEASRVVVLQTALDYRGGSAAASHD